MKKLDVKKNKIFKLVSGIFYLSMFILLLRYIPVPTLIYENLNWLTNIYIYNWSLLKLIIFLLVFPTLFLSSIFLRSRNISIYLIIFIFFFWFGHSFFQRLVNNYLVSLNQNVLVAENLYTNILGSQVIVPSDQYDLSLFSDESYQIHQNKGIMILYDRFLLGRNFERLIFIEDDLGKELSSESRILGVYGNRWIHAYISND